MTILFSIHFGPVAQLFNVLVTLLCHLFGFHLHLGGSGNHNLPFHSLGNKSMFSIAADAVIKNVTSPTNSTPTALSSDYEVNNTINVSITTILVPSSRYIDISPTSATNALTTVFYGNVHKNDTSDNSTLLTIPYSATAMVHSRPAASTLIESLNGTTMDTNSTSAMSTSIRVSPSIAKSSNLVITLTASSSIAISTSKIYSFSVIYFVLNTCTTSPYPPQVSFFMVWICYQSIFWLSFGSS